MARSRHQLVYEWSRRSGGGPRPTNNDLQLLKQVALARGYAGSLAGFNEQRVARAIATTYGITPGPWNELKSLRAIVDTSNFVPTDTTIGQMNEVACLRAIVGGTVNVGGGGGGGSDFLVDESGNYILDENGDKIII